MNIIKINYPELALADMHLVRERVRCVGGQDHSRSIYRGPHPARRAGGPGLIYKIWNPTYIRRDNILDGLASGFYDATTAPALAALIVDGGICRGYAMEECTKCGRVPRGFYEQVKERTARTGRFHYDLTGCNIMRFAGGYSLIDLESVYPLREAAHLDAHHCRFAYADYERFVRGLAPRVG